MSEWELAELAERLADAIVMAPMLREHRVRWLRGYVHGYRGQPYEIDGIKHDSDFFPVVPTSDPYRQGFVQGRAERSRN